MPRGYPVNWPTQQRIEWLEHLEREGKGSRRGWHQVPYQCARLGWTRWSDLENSDFTEVLTDEGRRVLADWRAS